MTASIDLTEVDAFRQAIAHQIGFRFDDDKLGELAQVLEERIRAAQCNNWEDYRDRLTLPSEQRLLFERLRVGETYFFRNPDQFVAFGDQVLRDLRLRHETDRKIRILSAGCSTGPEPYTIAIILREYLSEQANWDVKITAIDVSSKALAEAKRGRYKGWYLRRTPETIRAHHFRQDGDIYVINDKVRQMVAFEERSLVDDAPEFWAPNSFDVIFCRNVTMYFPVAVQRAVMARLASSLCSDGYVFLGHAESMRSLSTEFELRHTNDTFYYRKALSSEPTATNVPVDPSTPAPFAPPPHVAAMFENDASTEIIRRASKQVAHRSRSATQTVPHSGVPDGIPVVSEPSEWTAAPVIEAIGNGQFGEALGHLAEHPEEANHDPDAMLLRAVALTNNGDQNQAEIVLAALLTIDEFNAAAHYLVALCREQAHDDGQAKSHDEIAIYLDPSFAMAHFHLGRLCRRAGDIDAARREFRQALALLPNEDATRILLFGGGFPRQVLVGMCHGELQALEEVRQ